MVQYLDHVEILGSNAVSHDLYVSNCTSHETNITGNVSCQTGYVHSTFNNTSNNNCSLVKSNDVDMHCDEVQEMNSKSKSGNHYLNQPVRCLKLCGHFM